MAIVSNTFPSKPGQGGSGDQDKRRDLRLELNKAEEEANEKKRKAEGISLEEIGQSIGDSEQKRRKMVEQAADKDEEVDEVAEAAEAAEAASAAAPATIESNQDTNIDQDDAADEEEER